MPEEKVPGVSNKFSDARWTILHVTMYELWVMPED